MDSTCIVCCDSLESHLEAAQVKMGTNYPVYTLDRALHSEPKNMRQSLLDVLNALPESDATVLIAIGYCGGSLDNICARQQLVIPVAGDHNAVGNYLLHFPKGIDGFYFFKVEK